MQQRAGISLKRSIRTFLLSPASPTKDWRARNKKKFIAKMAGVRVANLAESLKV
jgi:hypothetical protein